MNKNELTFEIEVMAFQVAIFLTSFRRDFFANYEADEFSVGHIVNHLKQILPKGDANWHIDVNALYQGLRYFKQHVEKVWHVLFIGKKSGDYAIPSFRSIEKSEHAGFVLKFTNASIDDARYTSMAHTGRLLDCPPLGVVKDNREFLLEKRSLPDSIYHTRKLQQRRQ